MPHKNRDQRRRYSAAWARRNYKKNRVKLLAQGRGYRQKHKARYNRRARELWLARVAKDPTFRLRANLQSSWGRRCRQRGVFDHEPFLQLLGMPWKSFCDYLEEQFTEEMTWLNYGSAWLADHRYPMHCFALTDPIERRIVCHFTNFVPLPPDSNLRKSCYFNCQGLKEWKRHWFHTYHLPGRKPAARACHPAAVDVPF